MIFVEVLLRQQAATYVTVSSLSKSRTSGVQKVLSLTYLVKAWTSTEPRRGHAKKYFFTICTNELLICSNKLQFVTICLNKFLIFLNKLTICLYKKVLIRMSSAGLRNYRQASTHFLTYSLPLSMHSW